jgi:serine phosphatase RsbU (regulator of sigma subunit)
MLHDAGAGRFTLESVGSLRAGLDAVTEGHFAVVLLDLSLPDSFGLDTFRILHARVPTLPVVVLTGNDDDTVALRAVQEGAQDYLVKGRVEAAHLAHAVLYAPSRQHRVTHVVAELQATEDELRIARQIQQRLFPTAPPACPRFDIHGECHCANKTGGDVFDYLDMGGGKVGLVVGDVTSHGVGPALLMASTRAYLRALVRAEGDVGRVLATANDLLANDVSEGRNVTLILAQLDPTTGSLTHSSAGHHPPGLVLDANGEERCRLYATGMPLGIVAPGAYPSGPSLVLSAGDIVVLPTDGITEASRADGTMYGIDRLLEVVRRNRKQPARAIVAAIFDDVRRYVQGRPVQDDMTVTVVKCLG